MNTGVEILIAEDSRTQAELLQHLLVEQGYTVTVGTNGLHALTAARRRKPALVISDVEMPEMTGYEFCRALKTDEALKDVPFVLLTSLSDSEDILRGLEAGADYYVTKPYDGGYLLAKVRAILNGDARTTTASLAPTADRRQMLNLLLSIYEGAMQRNRELMAIQAELRSTNAELQQTARSEHAALDSLKQAQAHLVQSEKLAGLGQMVAGVAHEINNPLAFVINNAAILQRDVTALLKVLDIYRRADPSIGEHERDLMSELRELCDQIDLPYTVSSIQELMGRSRVGLQRIQEVVKNLRDFARLDTSDLSEFNLNEGVASTAMIVQNLAKQKSVTVESQLGTLPPVSCYPAKINQVIMNLLSNAVDACNEGGKVVISTRADDKCVSVTVSDTGSGIDPSILDRIFDPFFTTKPLGKGTGLGLSISYGIIHEHKGEITVDSSPGTGSRFTFRLPTRSTT